VSEAREPPGYHCALQSLAFSPDGSLLAGAGADYASKRWVVLIWNVRDRTVARALNMDAFRGVLEKPKGPVGLRFSPDGKLLASAAPGDPAIVWATKDWNVRARLDDVGPVICFAPDGEAIATPSHGRDAEVTVWDLRSARPIKKIPVFASSVTCLDFSPDGAALYVGGTYFDARDAPPPVARRSKHGPAIPGEGGIVECVSVRGRHVQ
jgi:WD40 repeat protein